MTGKTILERKHKYKHYSQQTIDIICKCDLQQFLAWYDDSLLDYRNNSFFLSTDSEIVIFPSNGYNFYTGKVYSPLQLLTDKMKINYSDSLYLLNYFYYKVKKAPLNAMLTGWTTLSYSSRCAVGKNNNVDLDYIIAEDLFNSSEIETKAYSYKRAIAYLCDKRHIDKDIVLNYIKQGFLKMDKNHNLCFVSYNEPCEKKEVVAISKKGTTDKRFCPNYTKIHNEGFFYARKEHLENGAYKELFVFESAVDMLSFLTLAKAGQVPVEHDDDCCYISLNGAGNRAFVSNILERYPSIQRVNLCLDNDQKGIEGATTITNMLSSYEVRDLRVVLKTASQQTSTYFKDWNDLLCKDACQVDL